MDENGGERWKRIMHGKQRNTAALQWIFIRNVLYLCEDLPACGMDNEEKFTLTEKGWQEFENTK